MLFLQIVYSPKDARNITSGQSNLTQGRIAAGHGRFSRIRQVAPRCTPYIESQKMVHMACTLGLHQNGLSTEQSVFQTVHPEGKGKVVLMATSVRASKSAMSSWDSLTPKTHS